jgi:methylated-DNA-[protein]-cysteine S-methyltransferase
MSPLDDLLYTVLPSPIGELLVYGDQDRIAGIHFLTSAYAPQIGSHWHRAGRPFAAATEQLDEYFEGHRTCFNLPLRDDGGTPFFREVWAALQQVPYGATSTYSRIANEMGRPGGARAVGLANARNPFSIVVPCHRVMGSQAALRGYAGGLRAKHYLLSHEARISSRMTAQKRPDAHDARPGQGAQAT